MSSSVGTMTAAPTATSSRAPAVHTVSVGNGGFDYEPAELNDVQVGDTVTFDFYPPDHSVARAAPGKACYPYENTYPGKVGFFSGQQYPKDAANPIPWNLTINSTEPIFYYCTAKGSCKDHQMVGVINPNSTYTLAQQKYSASIAAYECAPGCKLPSEYSSNNSNHGHTLSTGAIVGIAVGGAVFLIICLALFFYIGRTKSLKEVLRRNDATVRMRSTPGIYNTNDINTNNFGPPGSPDFLGSPLSPIQHPAVYGGLPSYSQHPAADDYPSGWMRPGVNRGLVAHSPPQMREAKTEVHHSMMAEMPSPPLPLELEAAPKGSK